ncbi:dihydrofolate reductase family protein [Nocardia crassostreae]|uniref:dihydrofolate reductase family protein n=1 Tax=Nocardia crassostreae TaxID=53428 RepID=UPI00082A8FBB|nr:dihydrofolate reductase family protein [Nocardia crassostreae]
MRKLVYYIAVSLDGYIAGPQGEFDFYPYGEDQAAWINARYPESVPTVLRPQVGMAVDEPNKEWDTVLMGRATYEVGGQASPYAHLKQYVVTTSRTIDEPGVEQVTGDPVELVRQLKKEAGKDIWLCGGGWLAGTLLDEIDQLIVKSYPVVAGTGIPMFSAAFKPTRFQVAQRKEFANGTTVTWLDRA